MERAPPPPPPAPPPPPPPGTPGNPPGTPGLGRVLREALQRAGQALGEDGGLRELLRRRRDSFEGPWKWLVFHRPVPPLIQDGPQCGLVALAMAGALLGPPRPQLGLRALLDTARARGYTRHGEMFSAAQMAALAQELLPCWAELLQGGLGGPNRGRVLRHLLGGRALLVPYDEDSNHAPSCRRGHKAHWALINGVVVAVPPQEPLGPQFRQDPEIPNVFHAEFGEGSLLGEGFSFGDPGGVQEGSGGVHGAGEGSQAKEMPDLGRGSHFGEGSQPDSLPNLRWGSRFGEGSHFGEGSRFEEGFCPDSLPDLSRGCQFEEGSQTKALPNFSRGCQFEEHSQPESVPDLGRGSCPESLPDGGRGSPFGAGILVLALQGKSPRPQLWALGELGASNAQLDELSPRRWGGGFVVPPGGVREGLGGRAVLLHPRETPPQ